MGDIIEDGDNFGVLSGTRLQYQTVALVYPFDDIVLNYLALNFEVVTFHDILGIYFPALALGSRAYPPGCLMVVRRYIHAH